MNPLVKFRAALAHKPKATMSTLQDHQAQLDALADTIAQLESEQRAIAVRRQSADELARKLTDLAASGKLKDPARLADALRIQRELAAPDGIAERLQAAQQARAALEQQGYRLKREAAQNAYSQAVMDYAEAAGHAGLPALAARVRELAPGAGVALTRCAMCGHDGAHFSDRGRLFQSDRGRRFSVIVDAPGCAQAMGFNVSQSSTIRLKRLSRSGR